MTAIRRIQKELNDLLKDPLENITAGPTSEDNIFDWSATLIGPEDTPYAGGLFYLHIHFSSNYPFKVPDIKFNTKIYHPNINDIGQICMDILKNEWSSALTIGRVLLSISSLLSDPNPSDPFNVDAANLYRRDIQQFNQKARDYTLKYAN
jgi:ubiquitin-conjugating enzyme E2 D/E